MRDPFAYENNALLISDMLVPDPLAEGAWNHLINGWVKRDRGLSLLEWIIEEGSLSKDELMRLMAEAGGVEILDDRPLEPAGESADRNLLEGNGFTVLGFQNGMGMVTGGPDFPPDIEACLGKRRDRWKWVLISPLRNEAGSGKIPAASGLEAQLSQTHLETWIVHLLEEARLAHASDVHFERDGPKLRIRIRTRDGMLDLAVVDRPRSLECIRYLKRKADFTTAENPLPQDGRIRMGEGDRETVYRASHIQTVSGETLVLRSINNGTDIPSLEDLRVPRELRAVLRRAAVTDTGLTLCTGATGSGKSTTLFSLLRETGKMPLKILSIEDPVEVELSNLAQSSVDAENGWTFPEALRTYLRQDPDMIFVGEIRDKESAEGAARAALTGHAVLSTLHAASPLAALDRLRGWGLAPGLIAETVRLVSHQRLVRTGSVPCVQARFTWIQPEPEALYDYLCGGPIPADWQKASEKN